MAGIEEGSFIMECPGCRSIVTFILDDEIDNMLVLNEGCKNIYCEWSKLFGKLDEQILGIKFV
jgi:hypothetical protein